MTTVTALCPSARVAVVTGASRGIARLGLPEAIAFLVSPPTRWISGIALRVDGGETKGS